MSRPTWLFWTLGLLLLLSVGLAEADDDEEEEEHVEEGHGGTGEAWSNGPCQHCHRPNSVGIEYPDDRRHEGITEGCEDCHLGSGGPNPSSKDHSDLDSVCVLCHADGNGEGAPVPDTEFLVQSQRAWQKQNNANFAEWVKGRGAHPDRTDCLSCHQGAGGGTDPAGQDCRTCHTWLQNDVAQTGFGSTVYQGTMDPETLLQNVKDMDGDGRAHNTIYAEAGCNGFCHNEGATVELAEAWGGGPIGPLGTSEPTGLEASATHGQITRCTDCHRVASPFGGPMDLHTTHIPFVTAEQAVADPDHLGTAACDYCHSSGPEPDALAGGCYNCHLSGHWPETVYWELETEPAAAPSSANDASTAIVAEAVLTPVEAALASPSLLL